MINKNLQHPTGSEWRLKTTEQRIQILYNNII